MGKLKEISSFKRREIAQELEREGSNNYAIMFKGKKTFWKVVRSKRLADKMVATLKRKGRDAKVVLTAAPVSEGTGPGPGINVRKNKSGMMGSKTQVHKDKKKELDKKAARKKILFDEEDNPRIPRKKGQPAKSKKHSDLYTDEDPKGTIHGLGFKDVATAEASVAKIKKANRTHAHKIQAAIAMEQRARVMGKTSEAAVYRKFIEAMKKKTKQMKEAVQYLTLNQIKKDYAKEFPGVKFKFKVGKFKGAEILSVLSPKGTELEIYDKVPKQGWTVREMKEDIKKDIEEGVDDPAIFKAIFLAGGPGSGKSFTVGKTGLSALGFRIVNSDEVFEFALKKVGLKATPKDIFSPKGQEVRKGAKKLTAKKMDLYLDGRLGLVIDGTGKDFSKIKKQATALKKIGYDVGMIFVNTNLETAIARDAKRARTLGSDKVKVMWREVQDNIGKFQNFFGGDFTVVDNSEGANWQKATLGAYKKVSKFAKAPVRSPIAKKWIKDAGGRLKDSFSIDIQRKLAMVECVLGNIRNVVQIAESITLQSTPSDIKEINKKLYGKNDKGRSKQTR